MFFEDTYKTIQNSSEGLFKDRGSKFFAYAFPIKNEVEVKDLVENLKKIHPKAVHFCTAFRLGLDRGVFRVNDDGEPSGSAGKPILNVLLSKDLTNILVVVVRYFGGTLLGVPGLINAYKSATYEAIESSEIIEKTLNEIYQIYFDFESMNEVMKTIKAFDLKIISQTYDNRCMFQFEFRKSLTNQVLGKLEKIENVELICQ